MEGENQTTELPSFNIWKTLERVTKGNVFFVIITALTFLLPLFVIPSANVTLDAAKMWLFGCSTILLLFLGLLRLVGGGTFVFTRHPIHFGVIAVAGTTLLSALVSDAQSVSLLGFGSQVGTASTIGLLSLLAFFAVQSFRDRSRVFYFHLALISSFLLLAIYQIIRFYGGADILSFGVFTSDVFSPVGKWNDFAVFSGLALIISVISIRYFWHNKQIVGISSVVALLATFFLIVIDFWVLWIMLAVVFAIYTLLTIQIKPIDQAETVSKYMRIWKKLPKLGVFFMVLGILFGFLFRFPIGDQTISARIVATLQGKQYAEIVLPPGPTLTIAKATISKNPLFGIGPNRFSNTYFLNKPEGINNTALWDSSFDAGFSHLTSFIATGGIVGTLAWLLTLLGVVMILRLVFQLRGGDWVLEYSAVSSGLIVLYLWIVFGFYLPNLTIVALMFIATGVLTGFLIGEGKIRSKELAFPSRAGWGVVLVPIGVLFLIGTLLWGYTISAALRADSHFQSARALANQGNIQGAETEVGRASSLSPRDAYSRLKTDLKLLQIQRIFSEVSSSEKNLQEKFASLAKDAIDNASDAQKLDSSNYLNYVSKATVSDLLATVNITGALEDAKKGYGEALARNPKSPRLYFTLARMELLGGNKEGARSNLAKAIELRPNYPEAIAAISELDRQNGNIDGAIGSALKGLQSDPNNFVIAFQLGYLYFQNKNYDNAIIALEQAVSINPYYADARYFLGVSYAKKNRKTDASMQFEEIRKLNPDNREILRVIKNLEEGRDPLID